MLAEPKDRFVLLRRTVVLDTLPSRAPARLWTDGRHVLSVNGAEVVRGPVRSDPKQPRYDVVDLAPHLREGSNIISVVARHFGTATSWWMPAPTTYTLGAGSFVFEALVGDEWIVSDRSWKAAAGDAWTPVEMPGDVACLPLESFDASLFPLGWDRPEFDDSSWKSAHEIVPMHTGAHGTPTPPSDPFGAMLPPIRTGLPDGFVHDVARVGERSAADAERRDDPVRQVLLDGRNVGDGPVTVLSFDAGRTVAGTIRLVVRGAMLGTVIDVAASEHVGAEGLVVPLGQHAGFRYICRAGDQSFETFDLFGFHFLQISVRTPNGEPAPRIEVTCRERLRPRPEGAGFDCSDSLLTRIHAIGVRTVDLSAHDAYVDCPSREQRAWTGDSVVHQMVDFVSNPDWSMPIWHPQLAAAPRSDGLLPMTAASDFTFDDRTYIPDWTLHWVRSVHNIFRYTGDRAVIADLLPVAERNLRWFESFLGDDGLLHDVTGWVLLDWSSVYSKGTSSTLNALWARALEDLAEMAEWLGNHGTAAWARERREGVRDGFDAFWDEGRGVYIDHVVDGVPQRAAAQHPGATALAAGLVPPHRIERVVAGITDRSRLIRHSWAMDTVTIEGKSSGFVYLATGYPAPDWDVENQMVEAQPFYRYVVHDGLARAGRRDLIVDLLRDWKVFVDAGEESWPECWKGGSRCHGWSSTPTRDLIVHVLGIEPAEPGYASVRVNPVLGDLEWATATVPTPHGSVTVEARRDGTLKVVSPVPVVR